MTEIGATLARELGPDRVAEDAATLAAHRTDYWILAHLRARQGRLAGGPACVVRPRSTAEVATTVRAAQRHGVAVVPYGGGSGVVGGAIRSRATQYVPNVSVDPDYLALNSTSVSENSRGKRRA